jgi:diguanylate cyclase
MLMRDPEEAARMLNNMRASGVRLSVDDFGTGYSSLTYL